MLFLNSILLVGLIGVLIPIILHLIRKQAAKPMDWGAMRFLFDTVALRRRKMEWEDLLLMATRCLLLALIALAIARPFVPPNSTVPWLVVMPLAPLGIAALAGSFVLSQRLPRYTVRAVGLTLVALAAAAVIWERDLNLKRFQLTSGRDVALIIDASTSMNLPQGKLTAFEAAVEEARQIVKDSPRGTAFTVVLGGPAPELKTATPLTHRADVLEILNELKPIGGPFQAQDAIGIATLSLAEGENTTKEILVFSDGQRIGWRTESPSAWNSLGNALDSLPQKPRLLLRQFTPPENFRNLAITSITLSRDVVGTDREVTLQVTIENTGTEPVTPGELTLEISGKALEPGTLGQLIPGQQETIDFRHRFEQAGAQTIIARLDARDDLPEDNLHERIILVKKHLPVLLVDGNPSGSFFERAAGFTALALAPTPSIVNGKASPGDHLMEPEVIAAPDIGKLEEIPAQSVVVLADVPRLPAKIAKGIERFVAAGGGLLILTGSKSDASFYNAWEGSDGPLCPAPILDSQVEKDGINASPDTFDHPALTLFADTKKSDLGTGIISVFRKVAEHEAERHVVARYSNGEPFLLAKSYGEGRIVHATCGFDTRSGTLPAKRSFVPFVHELMTWLAGAGRVQLNTEASWSPSIFIPGGGGLRGEYYRGNKRDKGTRLIRLDSAIDFNWGNNSPAPTLPKDRFTVHWSGRILPPATGTYTISAEADDSLELKINGKTILNSTNGKPTSATTELKEGQAVDLEIKYQEEWGEAYARLYWTPPGGSKVLIPSSALIPPVVTEGEDDLVIERSTAIDPDGLTRKAQLTAGRRGRMLEIEGTAIPGIYQLKTPPQAAKAIGVAEGSEIPVAVTRNPAESRLDKLSKDDRSLVESKMEVIDVRHHDDVLSILSGKSFGEELWKILAIAAFFFLLLEIALARWISRARHAAEDGTLDFEHIGEPDASFVAAFKNMKETNK